jgi:hypothetical protein
MPASFAYSRTTHQAAFSLRRLPQTWPVLLLQAIAVAVHLQDMNVVGRRSSRAPVRRSEPRISVHSWKSRLLVTRVEVRS